MLDRIPLLQSHMPSKLMKLYGKSSEKIIKMRLLPVNGWVRNSEGGCCHLHI